MDPVDRTRHLRSEDRNLCSEQDRQWLKYIFGGSGIVPAALIAIILNIVIPKNKTKAVSEEVPAEETKE